MLKWILVLFSIFLVGCNQEVASNFHLEAVQSSEARQNEENSRYYISPEDELILVEEFSDARNFNFTLTEYPLEDYVINENNVLIEYDDTSLCFEKLSDSVYTSEKGTWYNFVIDDSEDGAQAEVTDQRKGSLNDPYQIGETARTSIRYLDDELETHMGVIELTISQYFTGQEAEDYVLNNGDYNKAAPEGLQWFVADVTLSFVEGSNGTSYTVNLPFRVYQEDGGFIAQNGENEAVLNNGIEGTKLYPKQTGKGKIALWIPEGDLSDVTFELETGKENIWFGLSESL